MCAATPETLRSRLLLVDDDPSIHQLVAVLLGSQNVEVMSATDGAKALEIARRQPPDLILLDFELPGANGLEVFKRLRAEPGMASTPVVFITGNHDERLLAACFRGGASDYICKPFCAGELRARVRSHLDRKHSLERLEEMALHDTLTGLPNRGSIRTRIQAALDGDKRHATAVLYLDFDRFKLVNDSLGHDVGDVMLQQIAERLRKSLRSRDGIASGRNSTCAARLGGDEFVVLLDQLNEPGDALAVANRLLATLAAPFSLAGHQVCSTVSIGVVTDLRSYSTSDQVLRAADTAMYEAKAAGRGRYALFDASMLSRAEEHLRIENQLRSAIANEELFLAYQPIVALATGRTVGFEALVRWNHPERGAILPADFLAIAEESGLIVPLGAWVLDRACQDFAEWRRTLGAAAPQDLHVNLSRKQLLLHDLREFVGSTLQKYNLPPQCLHLEITETEIMQNPAVASATLADLRNLGVKIDMDNFGTGHSSLTCLQELPIDVLKIDRSFIANMERSRSFAALVHAVTTLGQNLGLVSVAEGIETPDQLAMLQSLDCDFGQGYVFAKPMPAEAVVAHMTAAEGAACDAAAAT
jgi:diguanylate cyclase (GGDEF)-like protein